MAEFRMPSLGSDMEAGTLVEWTKHPGDEVKRGDIIAVVDTQKGAIEIEVFEDGVLERTLVQPGATVPVGTVLAVIRGGGQEPGTAPARGTVFEVPSVEPVLEPPPETAPPPPPPASARVRASPLAKRLAAERGVDVTAITGTGTAGAITREDVERAADATQRVDAPLPTESVRQAPGVDQDRHAAMRAAIAAAMSRAKREIPHYYLSTTIDLRSAVEWLRRHNESVPMEARLLPAALLLKAVALALHEVPDLNGHWVNDAFRPGDGIHVGVAISLRGGGLVAPAVRNADSLDLLTLMRQIRDVVGRARSGSLRSSELSDATVTVTNLGDQGVEAAFGIIYPPQVALVGFGKIADRPWAVNGRVEVRPLATATLSADHRATDGHRGGVFLAAVDRWLQTPEQL